VVTWLLCKLAEGVDAVLDSLGMNQTVLIAALYKRVLATGSVPFELSLTQREQTDLRIRELSKELPTRVINDPKEFDALYDDDDEY
jgi:DNA-damage-inducible protein J